MSDYIQDKEVFIPEPRELKIGEKTFDLSEVPFEFSLRFYEHLDIFTKMSEGNLITSEDYKKIFSVIYDTLNFIDESVEEKWLRKKITLSNFPLIMTTLSSGIFYTGKKKEEPVAVVIDQSTSAESLAV